MLNENGISTGILQDKSGLIMQGKFKEGDFKPIDDVTIYLPDGSELSGVFNDRGKNGTFLFIDPKGIMVE